MAEAGHRAGVVAILGRPNAGKSTLLNRLVGEKLAIVTARPQTTRSRILGIVNRPGAQLLLLDTPGLVPGGAEALDPALNEQVAEAAAGCDVALVLVDPEAGWGDDHRDLLARLRAQGTATVLAATQIDRPGAREAPWPPPGEEGGPTARVSARTGEGLEGLLTLLLARLPESPPLYPEDQVSDRPLRFLAAELVREAASEELRQELPYQLAVEVVEFDERDPRLVRIRADLIVERESQKGIVIGAGGSVLKRIGVRARREIETMLGGRVHLALWVKVEPGWRRRPKRLKSLGYR